ncbi:YqfO family protein [Simiduia sp. 21SJ11W-1]|uniref:Nif3-like dinuclear metal center hexameric protein n=1 Tax=Simiduia sp. 21SJ11W-1 TaxID=2909669 RepID=UPI00209E1394|nr:YqfO family protein [Simiduia sp. 21SJ11W-1]UTA46322.1 YqfO family protein [Simiduia sp. 21SJ11W-1]
MFKLCVYIPESHLEVVKRALFDAGAGRQGDYECCCWQVPGQGQFKPAQDAQPFIGAVGELTHVAEYRVEMLVAPQFASAVIKALRNAHPYEEPAFDLVALVDARQFK